MAAKKTSSKLRPRKPIGQLKERRKRPWWKKWLKRAAYTLVFLALAGFLGLGGLFWYYGRDLPDVTQLRDYAPAQTTRVVDRDGELIGEVFTERRTVVEMERIPRHLVLCVLAAEDADFYQHEGLDYPGIVRAVLRDIAEGRAAQGASTITQQVVKLLLLSHDRTLERKIRELILARRLEQELDKEEILHLYLNTINFGHGRYGVQEAAQFYFGKDVEDLTLAESSLIAGVPQAPARLSPRAHPEAARRRQRFVLSQLEAKRAEYWPDLALEDIEAAREEEVALVERPRVDADAPEIMSLARRTLRDIVGRDAFRRGGYTVHTSIDLDLQRATREALRVGLRQLDERQGYRAPLRPPRRRNAPEIPDVGTLREGSVYLGRVTGVDDEESVLYMDVGGHEVFVPLESAARYNPRERAASGFAAVGARAHVRIHRVPETGAAEARLQLGPQGAVVVIDPRTRDVLAMIGSYEDEPGFDRARQAVRQPGSTFKPFVYALGIRSRAFTPATVMIDAPAVYDRWRPSNYETWRHEGPVRIRVALARSINLVAIRAIEEIGPAEVAGFARELGIESELEPTLALGLGASGVRPLELTNAYASFAAGGRWAEPRIIARIDGPDGREVDLPARENPRDVLTPAEAYVVTSMLTSVVQEGTGRAARELRRPAAGKTGTSNEARDAWFVGYTPNVVAGVWVGFDDSRSLGRREGGSRSALPIWIDVIRAAEQGQAVVDFPRPSGVETALIDPATGLLAYEGMEGALEEVFLEGTVPSETARSPDVADTSTFLMEQLGGG